jgi:hypothetical protein
LIRLLELLDVPRGERLLLVHELFGGADRNRAEKLLHQCPCRDLDRSREVGFGFTEARQCRGQQHAPKNIQLTYDFIEAVPVTPAVASMLAGVAFDFVVQHLRISFSQMHAQLSVQLRQVIHELLMCELVRVVDLRVAADRE